MQRDKNIILFKGSERKGETREMEGGAEEEKEETEDEKKSTGWERSTNRRKWKPKGRMKQK
jgi:hypothetical protein